MRLQGLHHITMITGDAPATVEFYADVLERTLTPLSNPRRTRETA